MNQRIITGIVIGVIFAIPFVLGEEWFLGFGAVLMILVYKEFTAMLKITTFGITWLIGFVGIIIMYFMQTLNTENVTVDGMIGILVTLLILTVVKENFSVERAGALLVAVMYIGFGVASIVSLRFEQGLMWTTTVLVGICVVDIGAYFVGKRFGKRKLAESISPKKTIEGSIGGAVFAVITMFAIQYFWQPFESNWETVAVSIIVIVFGQLGDLIESGMKRRYQVKDSGKILPGHGGVFDRIDSWLTVFIILNLIF